MTSTEPADLPQPNFSPLMVGRQKALYVIGTALRDQRFADQLHNNPAVAFRLGGLNVPEEHETKFNEHVNDVAPELMASLRDSSQRSSQPDAVTIEASAGCTACKISAYSLAAVIAGIGSAALVELTLDAAIVESVATFLGVSAQTALRFLRGLGAAGVTGVNAIVTNLCTFAGAC